MALRLVLVLLSAILAGCAATGHRQWDPVFQGHDGLSFGVPDERMGMLFGSIAIAAEEDGIGSVSLHLRAANSVRDDILIFAANRFHAGRRDPDVQSDKGKVWVFSGQLPEGEYFIERAGLSSKANPSNVEWVHMAPAVPVSVKANGNVYLGRWQPQDLKPGKARVVGPAIMWKGEFRMILSNAVGEDQALLERRRLARGGMPLKTGALENPLELLKALDLADARKRT
jgi:hypothetical protein